MLKEKVIVNTADMTHVQTLSKVCMLQQLIGYLNARSTSTCHLRRVRRNQNRKHNGTKTILHSGNIFCHPVNHLNQNGEMYSKSIYGFISV